MGGWQVERGPLSARSLPPPIPPRRGWRGLELVWRLIGVLLIELGVFLSRAIGLAVPDLTDKLTIDRDRLVDG